MEVEGIPKALIHGELPKGPRHVDPLVSVTAMSSNRTWSPLLLILTLGRSGLGAEVHGLQPSLGGSGVSVNSYSSHCKEIKFLSILLYTVAVSSICHQGQMHWSVVYQGQVLHFLNMYQRHSCSRSHNGKSEFVHAVPCVLGLKPFSHTAWAETICFNLQYQGMEVKKNKLINHVNKVKRTRPAEPSSSGSVWILRFQPLSPDTATIIQWSTSFLLLFFFSDCNFTPGAEKIEQTDGFEAQQVAVVTRETRGADMEKLVLINAPSVPGEPVFQTEGGGREEGMEERKYDEGTREF